MQDDTHYFTSSWSTFISGDGSHPATLDNCVSLCCTAGRFEHAAVTTALTLCGPSAVVWSVQAPDDDWKLALDVQSFLQCLQHRHPIPRQLQAAWERFYRVYNALIGRTIRSMCRVAVLRRMQEDFVQEVWREILHSLQRLTFCPANGSLAAWLIGLTRQCVFGLLAKSEAERDPSQPTLDKLAICSDLGPEECCLLSEILLEREDLLTKFRARTSEKTYEIFHRRHFAGDDVEQIATAVGLERDVVYRRYWRAKRVWSDLVRRSTVWGQCEADPSSPHGNR